MSESQDIIAANSLEEDETHEIESDSGGFSITASDILEYLFCPRFTYFQNYLDIPQHEEKRFKVQKGRTVHEDKILVNPQYLRKKLGVVERKMSVYLSSSRGIRGIVDEILFLDDGSAAPLDYKYAEYKDRTFKNHKYQLTFYGQLINEHFQVPVNKGYIVYTRSRNKLVDVSITRQMYCELDKIINDLLHVVQKGVYPKPTKYKARCSDCCYRNICEKVI
ncbi:MAG: CRISPR-associated protein Cas4 [Deltaproteobacteria bacterium]|nr:CRISPR-associated protein Cas4 [Deltaproteobacteria bacterium]